MTSKGETFLHLGRTVGAIMACASLCLLSSEVLAQPASNLSRTSVQETSWSFQAPREGNTPHLVLAMAEPAERRLSLSDSEATETNPEKGASAVSPPSRISGMNGGGLSHDNKRRNLLAAEQIQIASLGGPTKVFTLLDDSSAPGSFRYEPRKKDFRPDQWSADSLPSAHPLESSFRPLFQVQVGNWRLPVMLSAAAQQ